VRQRKVQLDVRTDSHSGRGESEHSHDKEKPLGLEKLWGPRYAEEKNVWKQGGGSWQDNGVIRSASFGDWRNGKRIIQMSVL